MLHPGIDLGTTFSLIAQVNAHGQPTLFPDVHDANLFRTPSLMHVAAGGCLVGNAAEEMLAEDASLPVVRFVKALLGQADYRHVDAAGRAWSAPALTALILRKLMADAATFAGEPPGAAVVTVPARFTDEERRATLMAADLAGLGPVRLVEEPVAAAVFYGGEHAAGDQTLLVYDFGGGTFDVTLLQASPDGLFVLATDGDAGLGGRVVDEAVMSLVDEEFRGRFGVSAIADPPSAQRLRRLAEDAKIRLSRAGATQVRQPVLLANRPYEFVLLRSRLEAITDAMVERSITACERCLDAAGLQWADVDRVMLTGGASLMPGVTAALGRRRPIETIVSRQPHQAVAFGAALLADRFSSAPDAQNIHPIATAALALRVRDPQTGAPGLEVLVPRHAPLPARQKRVLHTARADQTRLTLEFVQVREAGSEPTSLGRMAFGPIEAPRLHYPVEVEVEVATNGLVHVSARDPATGRSLQVSLQEGGPRMDDFEDQRRLVQSAGLGA